VIVVTTPRGHLDGVERKNCQRSNEERVAIRRRRTTRDAATRDDNRTLGGRKHVEGRTHIDSGAGIAARWPAHWRVPTLLVKTSPNRQMYGARPSRVGLGIRARR